MSLRTTETGGRWESRPILATVVRVIVFLVPIVAAILVGLAVSRLLFMPQGPLRTIAWWAILIGATFATVWLVERLARKAMPLALLLNLSLAFPDRAPSRFRVALRSGSTRLLRRQVSTARDHGVDDDPTRASEFILSLSAALAGHDRITRGHAERTRAYADLIAEEMGLPEEERNLLRWASLLHDVGKLTIAAEILNRQRNLTADEWDEIRHHPADGFELTRPLHDFLGEYAIAILQHHERWDGEGYPAGIAGEDLTLGARVVTVADAYDSMTAIRSYQRPISAAAARRELASCAGTQFDPTVVRAFLNVALGKLRWVMGPLAFLAQLPVLGNASRVPSGAVGVTASGFALMGMLALGALPVGGDASPPPVTVTVAPEGSGLDASTLEVTASPANGVVEVEAGALVFTPNDAGDSATITYRVCTPAGECIAEEIEISPDGDATTVSSDRGVKVEAGDGTLSLTSPPQSGTVVFDTDGDAWYLPDPGHFGEDEFAFESCGEDSCTELIVTIGTGTIAAPPVPVVVASAGAATTTTSTTASTSTSTTTPPTTSTPSSTTSSTTTTSTTTTTAPTTTTTTTAPTTTTTTTTAPTTTTTTTTAPTTTTTTTTATTTTTTTTTTTVPPSPPAATDDTATTDEDVSVTIDVLANDTGNLDPSTLAVTKTPRHGTATLSAGGITYTPEADWWGNDDFDYDICDGLGNCDKGRVDITVSPVNDVPVAVPDTGSVAADQSITIDVVRNDTDADGDDLEIASYDPVSAQGGTVTCSSNQCTYTPLASGVADTFTYTVTDGSAVSAPTTVTIEVDATGDVQAWFFAGLI